MPTKPQPINTATVKPVAGIGARFEDDLGTEHTIVKIESSPHGVHYKRGAKTHKSKEKK